MNRVVLLLAVVLALPLYKGVLEWAFSMAMGYAMCAPLLPALAGGAEIETALNDHYPSNVEKLGERFDRFRR